MATTINTPDIRDACVTSPKLERDVTISGNITVNGYNGSEVDPQYNPAIKVRDTANYLSIMDTTSGVRSIAMASLVVSGNYASGWSEVPSRLVGETQTKVGSAYVEGDVVIGGNLTVRGSQSHVVSETVDIADNIVLLNSNVTAAPTEDAGFEIERGTSNNMLILWDETNDYWKTAERRIADSVIINSSRILDQTYADARYALLTGANFTGSVGFGIGTPESVIHVKSLAPTIMLSGSAINQTESGRIRFTETSGQWDGGFIHYNGSADTFYIGVHNTVDTLATSDINAIAIAKTTGDLTLVGNITMAANKTVDGVDISSHNSNGITNVKHVTDAYLAALAGTNGTPSSTNKYVTNSDTRLTDSRTPTAHGDSLHNALSYFDTISDGTTSASATSAKQNVKFTGSNGIIATVSSDATYDAIVTIDGSHNHDGTYMKLNPAAAQTVTQNVTFSNDVTITGNLTANGANTIIWSNEVKLGDSILTLNAELTADPTEDGGIEIERGTKNNVALTWNETSKYWQITTPNGSDVISASRIIDKAYGDTIYMPISKTTFTDLYVGDGTAYGDVPFVVADSANYNDSTILTTKRDGSVNPVYAITPSDSDVYVSVGAYYNNGAWVHSSNGTNSLMLTYSPGNGVKWSSSNNSSTSWNVASAVTLWNNTGYWTQPIQASSTANSYFAGGGYLGVGTNAPGCQLDVESATYPPTRTTRTGTASNSVGTALDIVHKTTAASISDGYGVGLSFTSNVNGSTNMLSTINAIRSGADNSGAIALSTNNAGVMGEKLRIMPNGRVGIGNSSPGQLLNVGDAIANISAANAIVVGDNDGDVKFYMANDANNFASLTWQYSNKAFVLGTVNAGTSYASTVTIKDGCLGVGVSPTYTLDVLKSTTNAGTVASKITSTTAVTSAGTYNSIGQLIDLSGSTISASVTDSGVRIGLRADVFSTGAGFAGTLTTQMGIQARAGIGASATSGAAVADVYGIKALIYNTSTGTTITNAYGVHISNSETSGTITNRYDLYASSANAKNYFAGAVGIGVASPSAKLHIQGATAGDGGFLTDGILIENTAASGNAGEAALAFKSASTGINYWITGINQTDAYQICYSSSFNNAATALAILSSGNVGIGNIAPGEKLEVTGVTKATSFTATGTNSLLVPSGNGSKSVYVDAYNYFAAKSLNNDVWLRSVSGAFTFQSFDDADDSTRTFQLYLPDPATSGNDNLIAEIGQRRSGGTAGSYKGVRIVHYAGSAVADGYLQAGDGVFNSSLKVGANAVWHAGNFDPTTKLNANADKYLSGVSGSGNGTVTFTVANGTNVTWDASHTHNTNNAIQKFTALNSTGGVIGTYTAPSTTGEVKLKAGSGITMTFATDTITLNADASASYIPKSTLLSLTSANSYTATFTHNLGTTGYVVLLGTDNPQRHVYYQKTANAVTIYLDDTPFGSPTVEVSVMVQVATN